MLESVLALAGAVFLIVRCFVLELRAKRLEGERDFLERVIKCMDAAAAGDHNATIYLERCRQARKPLP